MKQSCIKSLRFNSFNSSFITIYNNIITAYVSKIEYSLSFYYSEFFTNLEDKKEEKTSKEMAYIAWAGCN